LRICIVFTLAVLAALLLLPGAAAARGRQPNAVTVKAPQAGAPRAPLHRAHVPEAAAGADGRRSREQDAPAPRIPARAAVGSTCTVSGTVLDYDGYPVAGADVELSYADAPGHFTGWSYATTGPDGSFGFSNVPVTNQGRLWTWATARSEYRRHDLAFAPGANYYELRPGQVAVEAVRSSDGDWNDWTALWVACYGPHGTADREIVGTSGYAYAVAPSFDYATVEFWANEETEVQTFADPVPVAAGATSRASIQVFEEDSRRIWVDHPYWASGPPDARITVALENWPAGYRAQFYGDQDAPDDRAIDYAGEWTSSGRTGYVTMTVPSWATAGYQFHPHAWRSDDLWAFTDLDIHDFYQVCTLKPSASSFRRGQWITVSGVIPTQGHWGSRPGIRKTVTLYAHQGPAKVPTKWDPRSEGWAKVSSMKADGLGRYTSKRFRPNTTLTLVVRYPGDDWYWGAYTGARKITVK
jgi:hypothetical protein